MYGELRMRLTTQLRLRVYCTSMVATLTLSSYCRTFIEYPDSRKVYQPFNGAIFIEHPVHLKILWHVLSQRKKFRRGRAPPAPSPLHLRPWIGVLPIYLRMHIFTNQEFNGGRLKSGSTGWTNRPSQSTSNTNSHIIQCRITLFEVFLNAFCCNLFIWISGNNCGTVCRYIIKNMFIFYTFFSLLTIEKYNNT